MPYLEPKYLDPIVCQYKNDLVSISDSSTFKILNKNRNIILDPISKINVCKVVKHDISFVNLAKYMYICSTIKTIASVGARGAMVSA